MTQRNSLGDITVLFSAVTGKDQTLFIKDGNYWLDSKKWLEAFAIELKDGSYKLFVLHAKHLPPPKVNYLKAAIAAGSGAATGAVAGSARGIPGAKMLAAIGSVLELAVNLHHQYVQSYRPHPQPSYVYIDKDDIEYFYGPKQISTV